VPDPGEQQLLLSDWLVLCVVCEKPVHGFAVAGLFSRDGSLGQAWQVSKPAVYAAMQRLERLGLVQMAGAQRTSQGPARSLVEATQAGRMAARRWLREPVMHGRNVRSELMMKLALLDRAGGDPRDLLRRQRAQFGSLAAALADQVDATTGIEHALALWRHSAMSATMQFLDEAAREAELASTAGR
jgi:DNA-binding PadR family transcriptional regulator